MPEETPPPRLVAPIVVAFCAGILVCVAAFAMRKFILLFLSAGLLWVLVLFLLYRLWWPGSVPGRRKVYRGLAVITGFLIFTGAWYIIVWLDPSLRPAP
jgi:hypothetical protein